MFFLIVLAPGLLIVIKLNTFNQQCKYKFHLIDELWQELVAI